MWLSFPDDVASGPSRRSAPLQGVVDEYPFTTLHVIPPTTPTADESPRTLVAERPNVVLVVADDMGFSDVGCYGGEIRAPVLDSLAQGGVRCSQFYVSPRCAPSRASLLTGLHAHQTGIGVLTNDKRPAGYAGELNDRCVTLAEVLAGSAYATFLSGKWHLSSDVRHPNSAWPTRRGFQQFFGTLSGCGSYYWPPTLMRGEQPVDDEPLDPEFFYTDAISDEAERFVHHQLADNPGQPFFLCLAYTAPHWPLHAHEDDIARYAGVFAPGWDELRARRMERLVELGIIPPDTTLSERDPAQSPWADEPHKAWQQLRMQVYAAQVDRMDQGIGRVVAALRDAGVLDNTLLLFLSDNGASDEDLPKGTLEAFRRRTDIVRLTTRDGRPVQIGNHPDIVGGPEDTFASYGRGWANLSNTPFRYYKRWVHEGGIASPLIVHWPAGGLMNGGIVHDACHAVDVVPTILAATGLEYPDEFDGRARLPLEGSSMLEALRGGRRDEPTLYWEHTGNAAVRRGSSKVVRAHPGDWELYDMVRDRTETDDVATRHREVVADLAAAYDEWAERVGVIPWENVLADHLARGLSAEDAAE